MAAQIGTTTNGSVNSAVSGSHVSARPTTHEPPPRPVKPDAIDWITDPIASAAFGFVGQERLDKGVDKLASTFNRIERSRLARWTNQKFDRAQETEVGSMASNAVGLVGLIDASPSGPSQPASSQHADTRTPSDENADNPFAQPPLTTTHAAGVAPPQRRDVGRLAPSGEVGFDGPWPVGSPAEERSTPLAAMPTTSRSAAWARRNSWMHDDDDANWSQTTRMNARRVATRNTWQVRLVLVLSVLYLASGFLPTGRATISNSGESLVETGFSDPTIRLILIGFALAMGAAVLCRTWLAAIPAAAALIWTVVNLERSMSRGLELERKYAEYGVDVSFGPGQHIRIVASLAILLVAVVAGSLQRPGDHFVD